MLFELFIVNENSIPISYFKHPEYKKASLDHVLVSGFMSAIISFTKDTFHTSFKGMSLGDKQIFVERRERYYGLGVFSSDEPEYLCRRTVRKLLELFEREYIGHDEHVEVSDDNLFMTYLTRHSTIKYSKNRTILATLLPLLWVTAFVLQYEWAVFSFLPSGFSQLYLVFAGGLFVISLLAGILVRSRWWALFISSIEGFMVGMLLFLLFPIEDVLWADYASSVIFVFWSLTAYILDHLKLGRKPVPSPLALFKWRVGKPKGSSRG